MHKNCMWRKKKELAYCGHQKTFSLNKIKSIVFNSTINYIDLANIIYIAPLFGGGEQGFYTLYDS